MNDNPSPAGDKKAIAYIAVLVFAMLIAYGYKIRTDGIFACSAEYYSDSRFLAYCNATAYTDYDQGAFWFQLEPEAIDAVSSADVIFLGNSRGQLGFSTDKTDEWFSDADARYYLFGFHHNENIRFFGPILKTLKPTASVYVLNVDSIFVAEPSVPMSRILESETESRRIHKGKRMWQYPHRFICTRAPALCGVAPSSFRSRLNGSWRLINFGETPVPVPVSQAPPEGQDVPAEIIANAKHFVAELPVDRSCILLTLAPSQNTRTIEAQLIADALGLTLIAPFIDGLQTFDRSHLTRPSAEVWSDAFFSSAGPSIRNCL